MGDRRLGLVAVTLLLSAVIHGLALTLPGWSLPVTAPNTAEPLSATLVTTPRPALAAASDGSSGASSQLAPPPPPRPRTLPRNTTTAPPVLQPVVPPPSADSPPPEPAVGPGQPAAAEAPPSPALSPATSETPPSATPPPTPGMPTWPRKGRIVYDVFRGEENFLVGQAEHSWEQDGRRYRMQAVVETVGLAAMMRDFHYVQRSEGRVTAGGLAPEQFRVEQDGKRAEWSDFDWAGGEAVVHRAKGPERRAPIKAGDQDVLSIWHQLALMGEPSPHLHLTLVSNKAATPAELEALGVDVLNLPMGYVVAHHLRARALDGSLSIDIWLAEKFGYLPVRVLFKDRQGETFDQRAREVFRGDKAGSDATAPPEN